MNFELTNSAHDAFSCHVIWNFAIKCVGTFFKLFSGGISCTAIPFLSKLTTFSSKQFRVAQLKWIFVLGVEIVGLQGSGL